MPGAEKTLSERVEALIEEAAALVEEIEVAGGSALEEAEKGVWDALGSLEATQDELQRLRRKRGQLLGEKDDLPLRHSRALLDDDESEACAAKVRYAKIGQELEEIENRIPELEAELERLGGKRLATLPTHLQGIAVQISARGEVSKAHQQAIAPLSRLHEEVSRKITTALENATDRARVNVSEVQALRDQLRFDQAMVKQRRQDQAARDTRPAMSGVGTGAKGTGAEPKEEKPAVISNRAGLLGR